MGERRARSARGHVRRCGTVMNHGRPLHCCIVWRTVPWHGPIPPTILVAIRGAVLLGVRHNRGVGKDAAVGVYATLDVAQQNAATGCVVGEVTECLHDQVPRCLMTGPSSVGIELFPVLDPRFYEALLAFA
eukprot:1195183-Prorocentrum_minimum.AAC.1